MTDRKVIAIIKPSFRRDLNEFLWYRNGEVEASKFWCNVGCGMIVYWMYKLPAEIARDWLAWTAVASLLIAPDLARKLIAMKSGDTSTTTEHTERTSVKTIAVAPATAGTIKAEDVKVEAAGDVTVSKEKP